MRQKGEDDHAETLKFSIDTVNRQSLAPRSGSNGKDCRIMGQ
jgi:hypothetical protein